MTLAYLLFLAVSLVSTYVQTKSYALARWLEAAGDVAKDNLAQEYDRLRCARRVMSPFIAGLAALLVAWGGLVQGNVRPFIGILFTVVWIFAALGDIFIEGSYSVDDDATKARFYMIGMGLFIIFTLGLGVGLIINAMRSGVGWRWAGVAAVVSALFGWLAYGTLVVAPENRTMVLVYLLAVVSLLCGGLLSAVAGNAYLAYIGIGYFVSDWCVGLRDMGKAMPLFFQRNILIVILVLYYSIMFTSILYVS